MKSILRFWTYRLEILKIYTGIWFYFPETFGISYEILGYIGAEAIESSKRLDSKMVDCHCLYNALYSYQYQLYNAYFLFIFFCILEFLSQLFLVLLSILELL